MATPEKQFVFLYSNGKQVAVVKCPVLYQDIIASARKHIPGANNIANESVIVQVRAPELGVQEFIGMDEITWPGLSKWITGINISINAGAGSSTLSKHDHLADSNTEPEPPNSPTSSWRALSESDVIVPECITLSRHLHIVEKWRMSHRNDPWIILPADLHESTRAYISLTPKLRDDGLLPTHPVQRRWIKKRCSNMGQQSIRRPLIANEGAALYAALSVAHGEHHHKDTSRTSTALRTSWIFGPSNNFISNWCSSCPGCRGEGI